MITTDIYFPGDPAFHELFMMFFGLISLIMILLYLIFSKTTKNNKYIKVPFFLCNTIPLVIVFILAYGILLRNYGEWADLKKVLNYHYKRVDNIVQNKNVMISYEEYSKIKKKLFAEPIYFKAKSFKNPLRIRMMTSIPPYVGVDFGNGQNAVFDLKTMSVNYSD